jgi:hypothetical protein
MVRCFDPARYPRIVAPCGSLDTVTLIHRERRTAVSGYLQRQAGQGMTEYIYRLENRINKGFALGRQLDV